MAVHSIISLQEEQNAPALTEREENLQRILRSELEGQLDYIRVVTAAEIHIPDLLTDRMVEVLKGANPDFNNQLRKSPKNLELLIDSIKLGWRLHRKQKRDSGEPYLAHPFQVAYILAYIGADIHTVCAGVLHDAIEESITKPIEKIGIKYKGQIDAELLIEIFCGSRVRQLVYGVTKKPIITSPETDPYQVITPNFRSFVEKFFLAQQIKQRAKRDPKKRLYAIKVADRLANLLDLDYLKGKEGRTAAERADKTIKDTREQILSLAEIVDRIYKPRLRIYHYLLDIVKAYERASGQFNQF